jgi:hypothetical protein
LQFCAQTLILSNFVLAQLDGEEVFPESRFGSLPDREPVYGQRPMDAELRDSEIRRSTADLTSLDRAAQPKPKTDIRTGVQEVALIASDLGFFPKTIFVTRDIPVRLFVTGASKKPLCFMFDEFEVRKQVRSQVMEELSFLPKQPGKYRFYCPINGSEGSLVVKDMSSVPLLMSSQSPVPTAPLPDSSSGGQQASVSAEPLTETVKEISKK